MPSNEISKSKSNSLLATVLILTGILFLVGVVFLVKTSPTKTEMPSDQMPEAQLDALLKNHRPVFVFYHSTTCKTCTDMMAVVAQVYPEFKGQVGLVDVNVHLPENEHLLNRENIVHIPAQVFINEDGQERMAVGGMTPEELRAELQVLAQGAANGD